MPVHHLVKESDVEGKCLYCSRELEDKDWHANHCPAINYKELTCKCGRNHVIKIDFLNQKHCEWVKEEVMNRKEIREANKITNKVKLEDVIQDPQKTSVDRLFERSDFVDKLLASNKL